MSHAATTGEESVCGETLVSVVIPTFREALNLPDLIPAVSSALSGAGLPFEIIVVDDDSQDGSEEIVRELAAEHHARILVRKDERGLSSAVIHGFRNANGRVLVCMDADLSHPPDRLPEMARAILDGSADFVIGSRYVPGGSTDAEWGILRKLNSRIATLLASPLTPVKDPMSGYFCLPRERFESAPALNPLGYKIGLELLIKTGAKRVAEIPIEFRDRSRGESKLTLRTQIEYLRHVARLMRFRSRRGGSPSVRTAA
ncbi:MAG: polyprenol monophosphomannose synthase [Phycisphaeraceae bacterium]|nr:MAG: polyprenol monophosphomannose synthase [Phycisphaeraceae bacterium]